MNIVTPETWYRLFWILMGVAALVAARLFLVNPILRALEHLRK